jgi:hypothetical protein
MAFNYLRIITSGSTLDWKFKALQQKPIWQKTQSSERTLDGGIDHSEGAVYQIKRYVLRVPYDYQTGEEDFGKLSDFIYLYSLNNPRGTPSNLLTLVDHHGSVFTGWLTGDLSPDPITTVIDGDCGAWYTFAFEFMVRP